MGRTPEVGPTYGAWGGRLVRLLLLACWFSLASIKPVEAGGDQEPARGSGGGSPQPETPLLARAQNLTESSAMRLLPWTVGESAMQLGSLGHLSSTPLRPLQTGIELVSDDQFVWGPNVGAFDIAGYLQARGSDLAEYAADIELWASYSSVNPKILIALLELQHGWLSGMDSAPAPQEVRDTIETTAMKLASVFYEHLHVWGGRRPVGGAAPTIGPTIQFSDGSAALLGETQSSGSVALSSLLASELSAPEFAIQAAGGFQSAFGELFPKSDLLSSTNPITPQSVPPESLLQFPFPLGATWLASGPHSWNGGSYPPPFSSIDFITGGGTCDSPPNAYAVAAAYGVAYRPQGYSCWLEIDHSDGWVTSYYHLQNLYSGAPLGRDGKVGTIACETCAGGFATGPHLHFSLKYNGAYVSLEGIQLTGWAVHVGSVAYNSGSFERDGEELSVYASLENDYQSYFSNGTSSLRFFGNGGGDIDRLKIRMTDPSLGPPADVGATDFTLDWWMKADPGVNQAAAVECGPNDAWRQGNILLDRDRFDQDRDYGVALTAGSLAFGVGGNPNGQLTICGSQVVDDGEWHHIAVQRRASDGWMWLYVDGVLDAQGDGPDGDISYPEEAIPSEGCGGTCGNDPFLVVGAEKHGVDPLLQSFSGWIDELRISTALRYASGFVVPSQPFITDSSTAALYHFDDSPANTAYDTSGAMGGPSNASRKIGGSPEGPAWSGETPFEIATATPTPTATTDPSITPTATATASASPTSSPTPTASNTPAPSSTPTTTATDTPVPSDTPTPSATPSPTQTASPAPTATNTATPTPSDTPTGTPTPTATAGPPTDINQDGATNVLDAQLCANVFLGATSDPEIVERSDVNGDGAVNVLDVQLIVVAFLDG